jgi:hypothetical protein
VGEQEDRSCEGITLDSEDLPIGSDGVSRGGRISIRGGLEPANEFSVIVHELAHELLHRVPHRNNEASSLDFDVNETMGTEHALEIRAKRLRRGE